MKRWAGVLLLILLLIQAIIKANAGLLPEMLWVCYPAALLLAIGLILDIALLTATGFLFHFCVGLPAYLLLLLANEKINWVSFLIHFLSPVIGFQTWRGKCLPAASSVCAMCLIIFFVVIAYFFTAPELNINHAFKPSNCLISDHCNFIAFGVWTNHLFNTGWMFSLLLMGRIAINRCLAQTITENTSSD